MRVPDRVIDKEGRIDGDRIGMTIDHSALAHIMSVLTDLYSDPELAVLREYSTNALDSHIDAGISRPIEVTLPSPLAPFLTIRDFGLGLNEQDIFEVYSRYGTSTKRDSDDVVGMLGLGCKSALTYTDQFTLTGVKDGIRTEVLIGRDEDGGGSMTVVASEPTDDENGVCIIIPAKKVNNFAKLAERFFSVWKEGTVRVNGEIPAHITGSWVTPEFLVGHPLKENIVVMGNVPYPVPGDVVEEPNQDWLGRRRYYGSDGPHFAIFAPIGAVNFTPSREALQMNKRTADFIKQEVAKGRAALQTSLFKEIEDARTALEAQTLTAKLHKYNITAVPKWKGREVRLRLDRMCAFASDTRGWLRAGQGGYGRYRKTGEWQAGLPLTDTAALAVFTNFEGKTLTAVKRAKLEIFLTSKNTSQNPAPAHWAFCTALDAEEKFWLQGHKVYDFTEVEAVELPKSINPKAGRLSGSYDVVQGGKTVTMLASDLTKEKEVWYFQGNAWHCKGSIDYRNQFHDDKTCIVCLPQNRLDKFRRDFPNAPEMKEVARKAVDKMLAATPHEDYVALAYHESGVNAELLKLDPERVNDPDLKEGITIAKRAQSDAVLQLRTKLRGWGKLHGKIDGIKTKDATLPYPLLQAWGSALPVEHTYLYVNAAYAANLKESA